MSHETTRFEEVYKVYHARIERYLVGLLGPAEAEDAVQEVFERISRKLASFRGDSELSTWVFRIARNAALDRLRVRRRRGREEARRREAGDTAEASLESPTDTLDESLARSEMGACIRDLIGDLPEPYRTVLVLSDLEGLNNREIAAELQVSLGAVKTRLHRARARLKRKLEAECTFDHDPRLGLRCEPRRVRPRNDASRR
ncbi:MAG: RNA polymerase sigma factor [Myxococcota bacterium]